MNFENIEVESKSGEFASYPYRWHPTGADSLAVIFPGQAYFKDSPLMWYSAVAAFQAGFDTLNIEYGFQANHTPVSGEVIETSAEEILTALEILQGKKSYGRIAFISKSIGTLISQRIPQVSGIKVNDFIFMTPLSQTVAFIRDAENMLVLVGTADPAFGASELAKISGLNNVSVVTFPDANHLLEIEGDYEMSLKYLKEASVACFNFCKKVGTKS